MPANEPTPQPQEAPPPEPEASAAAPRARRGSRGGRGRSRATGAAASAARAENGAEATVEPREPAPSTSSRRSESAAATEPAPEPEEGDAAEPRPARRRRSRSTANKETAAEATVATAAPAVADLGPLAAAIEAQARELASLRRALEARETTPAAQATSGLRVGVFVDAANAEKGREERRYTVDWRRVLQQLAAGRRLARAVAYAPISDDPAVSIETQRFVEPFLDAGFRVVTKPLKRFQGGAIKANLDIEIALDVIQMIDRLDVVCLVSGDGDFEALAEAVQARGVRFEVVSFLHNTAVNLRNAADEFIDLGRMREAVSR